MSSDSKSNSKAKRSEHPPLCVNQYVASFARVLVGAKSTDDFVRIIRSRLQCGACRVKVLNVREFDSVNRKLCLCDAKSKKYTIQTELLKSLKTRARMIVDSEYLFDPLIVEAMWTRKSAKVEQYRCSSDNKIYYYKSRSYDSWQDNPAVLLFQYRGTNRWIDINCPENMLAAYSSGSVLFSEKPKEREVPWSGETPSTDYEYELSL